MTEQVQLACVVSSTDPTAKIGLEIWLDDTQIYNTEHIVNPVNFTHEFADTDGKHQLRFVMKQMIFVKLSRYLVETMQIYKYQDMLFFQEKT